MTFLALETAHRACEQLRRPLSLIRHRDRKLHTQIRTAAASVVLNLAEGQQRQGQDRLHLYRIAAGSAAELKSALRFAIALGDLQDRDSRDALDLLDQVVAMLWRITH